MTLIADSAAVAALCKRLARADYITVDTEFMREQTFWSKLCLVQVAGPDEAAAIDPLVEGLDLKPFFSLLANKKVLKVFHGARQDVEIFYHLTGKIPAPLFDSQIAAMVCGFGDQVAYETLVSRLAHQHMDKTSRFTDWSLRPLTDKQMTYALGDVTYLRPVYEALRARIDADGRAAWLDEELAVLTDPNSYRIEPSTAWLRLKPRSTDRRYLAVLQAIAAWREEEAVSRDVPRNRVLRDESMGEIAMQRPRDAAVLKRIRGLSRSFASGKHATALIDAVARGEALPIEQAPQPRPKTELPQGIGPVIDLLKVLLKHKCEHHHVAQKLVATSADLERIAADDDADVAALRGWRRELFGETALDIKHGRLALAANGRQVRLLPVNGAGEAETTGGVTVAVPKRRRRRRHRAPEPGAAGPAVQVKGGPESS